MTARLEELAKFQVAGIVVKQAWNSGYETKN